MIFEFTDYRKFIKSYIAKRPKRGFGESKKICEYLQMSSTYFSQILSGLKQLSLEQANSLSEYMGLSELESEYFLNLVILERAGTHSLKKVYEKKLKSLKETSLKIDKRIEFKKSLTDEEKSIFYSTYLFSAVSLFTSTQNEGVSIEEIESRFELDRKKSTEIMRFLIESGLCILENSRYKMGTQSTHVGTGSMHHIRHHINWRLQAVEKTETLTNKELMYTVQVSLSKNDFERLREEIVQFIKKFLDTVYPSPAEVIANLNIDWFLIDK